MSKIKRIVTFKEKDSKCEGGVCPAFFKDDDDNYYVQGKTVSVNIKGQVPIGLDEDIVKIPKELIVDLFSKGGFNG